MSATAVPAERLITGEELFAMEDVGRCELIDGRIVPMSPTGGRHARVEIRLGRFLDEFVEEQALGWVVGGEAGLYTQRNPDRVRGADIAFFTKEQLPNGLPTGFIEAAPALVAEIMSPGDTWPEVRAKIREYFAIGTEQVWVVEPDKQQLHVYHSPLRHETLTADETLTGTGTLNGFVLPVAQLFDL